MTDLATTEHEDLMTLLGMIAAGEKRTALQTLAASPHLARTAVTAGATRQNAASHFFPAIAHYAYAGDTPLHFAAATYQRDVAEALVDMGADVRARNRRGAEPLHYAADGSPGRPSWTPEAQQAIIEFLIAIGADPNAPDKSDVAPLHRAVRTRSSAAVRALLAGGADALRRNGSGSTPLHLAVQNTGAGGSGSDAARAEQVQIIQILIEHGARPTDRDAGGRTARESARSEWVRTLLD
ncbi:MAG TPA: ankyrin repeat domain-containing protein [Limnochordia bacterium]|nr:ankyrin repeat domain-containing protein [Limnochordia bacterium]